MGASEGGWCGPPPNELMLINRVLAVLGLGEGMHGVRRVL